VLLKLPMLLLTLPDGIEEVMEEEGEVFPLKESTFDFTEDLGIENLSGEDKELF
jgi:hypothetical protein